MSKKLWVAIIIILALNGCRPSRLDRAIDDLELARSEQLQGQLLFYDVLRAVLYQAWLLTPDAVESAVETQGVAASCIHVTAWDTEVDGVPLEVWQCWPKPRPTLTPDPDSPDSIVDSPRQYEAIVVFDGSWKPEGAGYWEFRLADDEMGSFTLY